jgi:hypothetical protein
MVPGFETGSGAQCASKPPEGFSPPLQGGEGMLGCGLRWNQLFIFFSRISPASAGFALPLLNFITWPLRKFRWNVKSKKHFHASS